MVPHQAPTQLIQHLIPLWRANMAWAKVLLKEAWQLEEASDILHTQRRGTHQIPGTIWWMRTHGVGVDIYKTPSVGGIDFDFDKPQPDAWRLQIFFEKQLNDGQLPYAQYRELAEDEELLTHAIKAALHTP